MPEVQAQGAGMSPEALEREFQKIENAKADLATETTQAAQPAAEEKILGKYNSVDDLIAAHKSLQAEYTRIKQGIPPQQQQAEESEVVPPEEGSPQDEQSTEPEKETDLSQEIVTQLRTSLVESAGGADKYGVIQEWAAKNLPEERKDYFNNLLAQGKVDEALVAFKAIQYDYIVNNGWEPTPIRGSGSSQQPRGFRSEGEVRAAMSDPRYDSSRPEFDRAYHDDVVRRLAASTVYEPR